ncbi:hypothetical protein VSH64_25185 [Amycolatopsis rhabdoformis]|uniref:Uncharacterized protein n=1 Tax=Amycolatopsis rhabdoformis TaxID=1448059 RepID=A0ABZ1HXC4_9PSEU|nr:hypothetical protein [Amycolatopsis rhabdoformis]WSE26171.1 hypothetical protein VSH64_25185 [Amycolatopsis rhabdoformis]
MSDDAVGELLRSEMLQRAGLVVVDSTLPAHTPPPMTAWRPVVSGDAVPTATVPYRPDLGHLTDVDRQWESLAEQHRLFDDNGVFLISVGVASVSALPWAHVRRAGKLSLAQHLSEYPGEPEFVAMSTDARTICAATSEEYDVWLLAIALS